MDETLLQRIAADPNYRELRQRRLSFGWMLTIIMMLVYYGFIALIAFSKPTLATPLGSGVMTWAIPVGFGVILITILLTAIYVSRANSEFDELNERIRREALK